MCTVPIDVMYVKITDLWLLGFSQLFIILITLFYRELVFEKAYCQYRLNLPQDALKTLNTAASFSLKLKELKAQILYRLERYLITGIGVHTFLVT